MSLAQAAVGQCADDQYAAADGGGAGVSIGAARDGERAVANLGQAGAAAEVVSGAGSKGISGAAVIDRNSSSAEQHQRWSHWS